MNRVISAQTNELMNTLENTLRLRNQRRALARTGHVPAAQEYVELSFRREMSKLSELTSRYPH